MKTKKKSVNELPSSVFDPTPPPNLILIDLGSVSINQFPKTEFSWPQKFTLVVLCLYIIVGSCCDWGTDG